MNKNFGLFFRSFVILAFSASGSSAAAIAAAEPWDLSYLLSMDPNQVTFRELAEKAELYEEEYQKYNQVNGIIWQSSYDKPEAEFPTGYGSGGDSAIFTGHYIMAATYRALTTKKISDLDKVLEGLRGLHILTHVSGTPGVVARCAFPADQPEKWNYPLAWQSRIDNKLVYTSPENIPDVLNEGQFYPKMIFYTKATKDQLTGILLGLSVAWGELKPERFDNDPEAVARIQKARKIVKIVTEALWWRLRGTDFKLVDHEGRTGTNSTGVSGLIKLQLLAIYKEVLRVEPDQRRYKRIRDKYKDEFKGTFFLNDGDWGDLFNGFNAVMQYYAFNLRLSRAYSVFVLEEGHERREQLRDFARKHIWKYVQNHKNTQYTFMYNAMDGGRLEKIPQAIFSLKAHSLRPKKCWSSPLHGKDMSPWWGRILSGDVEKYVIPHHLRQCTTYSVWQKDPFSVGEEKTPHLNPASGNTGMDLLLPYWMGRYFGYVPAE